MGKTKQTVLDVGKHYLNKGHRYFTDNYYTSVELMTKLQAKNTLSCGTVNSNRVGLPKDMKKACPSVKKLKRGESLRGRMLAVTWMDTRAVNLLCNLPGCLGDADVQRRDKRGGAEITVSRPCAIQLYNSFMGGGGVDLSDQRVSTSYEVTHLVPAGVLSPSAVVWCAGLPPPCRDASCREGVSAQVLREVDRWSHWWTYFHLREVDRRSDWWTYFHLEALCVECAGW